MKKQSFATIVLTEGDHVALVPYDHKAECGAEKSAEIAVMKYLIEYFREDDGEHAPETAKRIMAGTTGADDFWNMEATVNPDGSIDIFQSLASGGNVSSARDKYAPHGWWET